jgi:hypothetical protein
MATSSREAEECGSYLVCIPWLDSTM